MEFIDRDDALEEVRDALTGAPRLFLDTEFESSREGTRLCLVQVSDGERIYLLDSLRLRNLAALSALMGSTEWVLHAGSQDVGLLLKAFALKAPPALYDTQIAWALQGPEHSVSLAYLQFKVQGIRSKKAHQADDWKRRPLPAKQLAYAASDVEHLPAIFETTSATAAAKGRLPIVYAASRETVFPTPEAPAPVTLASFRNAWQLDPRSQAALRAIIGWLNELPAADRAHAPEGKTLLALASRLPKNRDEMMRIKGVPRRWAERSGAAFLELIEDAVREARGEDFEPIDPPPYATFEEVRLDAWLAALRAELAVALEVAPELLMPGKVIRRLRAQILDGTSPRAALEAEGSWRAELALPVLDDHLTRYPLPPLG